MNFWNWFSFLKKKEHALSREMFIEESYQTTHTVIKTYDTFLNEFHKSIPYLINYSASLFTNTTKEYQAIGKPIELHFQEINLVKNPNRPLGAGHFCL
jgi:hypothetical protein